MVAQSDAARVARTGGAARQWRAGGNVHRSLFALLLTACAFDGEPDPVRDGAQDGGADAAVTPCARASDCETSQPCTTDTCEPGAEGADARGCVHVELCAASEVCRADLCVPICEVPDGDG